MFELFFFATLIQFTPDNAQPNWVDQLTSRAQQLCCQNNDGRRLDDPEWRTWQSGYQVLFTEGWVDIPESAVVQQKNLGIARVWSTVDPSAHRTIRCFLPGSLG